MFFPIRIQMKKSLVTAMIFCIVFCIETKANAADSSTTKTYRQQRVSRGGEYAPKTTDVYKGESPCRVGTDITTEIDSKFCGFYDYKDDMSREQTEQKK